MTVAELVAILQKHHQGAVVFLESPSGDHVRLGSVVPGTFRVSGEPRTHACVVLEPSESGVPAGAPIQ